MKKLRIVLADDHGLVRHGARSILQARRNWRVVGEAANGQEAVEQAAQLKPDVAIIDISMPGLDGIEVARQIRRAVPDTKILMLTMHESDQMVRHALEAGVHGYLLKSDLTESLTKAVEAIVGGRRFLTPRVSEIVLEGFLNTRSKEEEAEGTDVRATPREIQIIRLLAQGKSNKQIASELGITVRTVDTHRAKIMLRLGLHSLAELVHYAIRHQIVSE